MEDESIRRVADSIDCNGLVWPFIYSRLPLGGILWTVSF